MIPVQMVFVKGRRDYGWYSMYVHIRTDRPWFLARRPSEAVTREEGERILEELRSDAEQAGITLTLHPVTIEVPSR